MKLFWAVFASIFIVYFAASVSAQDECTETTYMCIDPLRVCEEDEQTCLPSDDVCAPCRGGLPCDRGVCPDNYVNELCLSDSDCVGPITTVPGQCGNNSRCATVDSDYAHAGDECDDDTTCLGNMNCEGGTCTGLAVGSACPDGAGVCAANLYCDAVTLKCAVYKKAGVQCQFGQCEAGTICGGGNRCVQRETGILNDACVFTQECAGGLVCSFTEGECVVFEEGGDSCDRNETMSCDNGGICVCDGLTGEDSCTANGFDGDCNDLIAEFEDCCEESDCRRDSRVSRYVEGGCVQENCLEEAQQMELCLNSEPGQCILLEAGVEAAASTLSSFLF